MKSYPKIIDRILEAIREEQDLLHRRPHPAGRRLHRLATRPGAGAAERRQKGRLLERGCHPAEIQISRSPTDCFKNRSAARNLTASSPPIAPASSGWARPASASRDRKVFINIDHHESNTRYADMNWVSAARAFHRRADFPAAQGRALADHQADCRLSVHRRFHRHRLVSISHHAARHVSRRRGTGHARREPRENLRRGLPVVSAVARAAAQAHLQQIPADGTTTGSPGSG